MNRVFNSRLEAARRLAAPLKKYRGQKPLMLAIPRGAVEMGRVLADRLGGELDVVLVRKIGAPHHAELAVGAVDETGWTHVADYASGAGANTEYLEREKRAQLESLQECRARYTPTRPPIDPAGRIAIVVDDGIATGETILAALHAVRARKPARLVCAVPVAPPDSLEGVRLSADEVVCLKAPMGFFAAGQLYRAFKQIEDDEVAALLAKKARARTVAKQ